MAGVQDVKAAVGEDHPFAPCLPGGHQTAGGFKIDDFSRSAAGFARFQFREQLEARQRHGAHLGHHDSRCDVREHQRVARFEAGRQGRCERGDGGVAGTRDVEHLARHGRHLDGFAFPDMDHALFGECHRQGLQVQLLAQASRFLDYRFAVTKRRGCHNRKLRAVGGDQRGAAVLAPLFALGVDQHGDLPRPRLPDDLLAQLGRQHSLGVV